MIQTARFLLFLALAMSVNVVNADAETGQAAWLRHARVDGAAAQRIASEVPKTIVTFESAPTIQKAREELVAGFRAMAAIDLTIADRLPPGRGLAAREGARPPGTAGR